MTAILETDEENENGRGPGKEDDMWKRLEEQCPEARALSFIPSRAGYLGDIVGYSFGFGHDPYRPGQGKT